MLGQVGGGGDSGAMAGVLVVIAVLGTLVWLAAVAKVFQIAADVRELLAVLRERGKTEA